MIYRPWSFNTDFLIIILKLSLLRCDDKMRLLIMPPSYRRKYTPNLLPAIERYDGILFRVLRKFLEKHKPKDLDIIILTEDLELIDANTPLPPKTPIKGKTKWLPEKIPNEKIEKNLKFLKNLAEKKQYSEIFVALSLKMRKALRGVETIFPNSKVIYIEGKGLGDYARHLKQWLGTSG